MPDPALGAVATFWCSQLVLSWFELLQLKWHDLVHFFMVNIMLSFICFTDVPSTVITQNL